MLSTYVLTAQIEFLGGDLAIAAEMTRIALPPLRGPLWSSLSDGAQKVIFIPLEKCLRSLIDGRPSFGTELAALKQALEIGARCAISQCQLETALKVPLDFIVASSFADNMYSI